MTSKPCLIAFSILLIFASAFSHAQGSPISVYPFPVQFGTVPENTTSFPVVLDVTNTTANALSITTMSFSGLNSGDFAFDGPTCVGPLAANQTCQMGVTFTPLSTGSLATELSISVQGLSGPVEVPLQGTGGIPTATITSLSPPSVYVNSPSFTLTVNGSNFVSGAIVYFGGAALSTNYVSTTQLTAQVPASLIQTTSDYVTVLNQPGGSFSNYISLNVLALDPDVSSATPYSVVAGTKSSPLLLGGDNFMNGAKVLWNGKALPTTYISTEQLQFQPTTADLATASIVQLSVSNPSPGGMSPAIQFDVTYPTKIAILDLPANNLVWDPYAQRIYASVPSSYGSNGNTIAVIDPSKARIDGYYFAGSEPDQLALSADSKYLYVGLDGSGSLQRFILPHFTPDISVNLGTSEYGGLNTALDLQVSPGNSHTYAVIAGSSESYYGTALYFYTDATQLAGSIQDSGISDIVFASPSTLYGYDGSGTVSQVSVNSSGGTLGQQWSSLVSGSNIDYSAGLIYGSGGQVLNPATGLLLGTYNVRSSCCSSYPELLPFSPINRVLVLGQTPFAGDSIDITSYNLTDFTPIAIASLSQLGNTTTAGLIPWGNSGLAFLLQSGCCGNEATTQMVLVQSPTMMLTTGKTKNPPPVPQTLSPSSATHGGWNFPVTIEGEGFVPGSEVSWNGTAIYAYYASSTQLTAYVPASAIASSGTANVVVKNPAPGGGPQLP